ncbi:MAG: CDP-alcohol phosphatidyltransferase family protein [Acutalibacteraceae bacterium]
MANALTFCRIICGFLLLVFSVFSPEFYAFYLLGGITDMLDGVIARKTDTVTDFGSKLDSVADFVFIVICLVKIIPVLIIPTYLLVWIGVIAVIKIINVISGFVLQKKLVAVHSFSNKLTGALMFILPLTLPLVDIAYSGGIVCAVATFAAIEEGHLMRTGDRNRKRSFNK